MSRARPGNCKRHDPRPVYVVGKDAGRRWHPLWDRNPRFTKNKHGAQLLKNGPGARPYVDYAKSTMERWFYTRWQVPPGELFRLGLSQVATCLIEPNLKKRASPNKQWDGAGKRWSLRPDAGGAMASGWPGWDGGVARRGVYRNR